jgi:hypothetical protein
LFTVPGKIFTRLLHSFLSDTEPPDATGGELAAGAKAAVAVAVAVAGAFRSTDAFGGVIGAGHGPSGW